MGLKVEFATVQAADGDDPGQAVFRGQREGDVERHPVPAEVEAINEIRVPAQFPAWCAVSIGVSGVSAWAIAVMPESPSRDTRLSI